VPQGAQAESWMSGPRVAWVESWAPWPNLWAPQKSMNIGMIVLHNIGTYL
jgi:hypothetical protein